MKGWKKGTVMLLAGVLMLAAVPRISSSASEPQKISEKGIRVMAEEDQEPEQSKKEVKARLTLGSGQSTPKGIAGTQMKLSIKVKNEGGKTAENVRIVPVIDDASDWPFEIDSMNYEQTLKDIKAGAERTAEWELTVRDDVETKAYKTVFRLSYEDDVSEYEQDRYIYVKMSGNMNPSSGAPSKDPDQTVPSQTGDDEPQGGDVPGSDPGVLPEDVSVPRVIVTGFSTDPGVVDAGSNFRLVVHVKNTSTKTAVSNLLFDFQAPAAGTEDAAEAPAFLPVSGSSSVYLDNIPAGATKDIAIELNARADLMQKPYSVALSMNYEGNSGTPYEAASSVAIPIRQAAKFEFSSIEVAPVSIQVGEEANLTCSLYNTGRVTLYNVKIFFEGEGVSGDQIFVGNISPGATGMIDGMLMGESETMGEGCKMIVSYEDESGNVSTSEEHFDLEVLPFMEEDPGMIGDETFEEEPGNTFPVVPVVAGIVLLLILLFVFLIRRRKKKRILAEEEGLADEVDRFTEDE